jgi:hypothetical protein
MKHHRHHITRKRTRGSNKAKLIAAFFFFVAVCYKLTSLNSHLPGIDEYLASTGISKESSNKATTSTATSSIQTTHDDDDNDDVTDIGDLFPIGGTTSMHDFLPKLMSKFTQDKPGRLIDFGAGVRDDDPMFPFMDAGWEGLLVDGDPEQREKMHKRFPTDTHRAHIDISYILADTMPDLLKRHGFDKNVDMLKIDIDSFDCYVMHTVLKIIQPKVITMEVNVKFPPHMRMAMFPGYEKLNGEQQLTQIPFDSEQRKHVYGCSLGYQVQDLMQPNGYDLIHMDWNNAIYVHTNSVKGLDYTSKEMSWPNKFDTGYWKRSDRDKVFGFNKEVVPWNDYTVEKVFETLQSFYISDSSHKNQHLYFANTGEEALTHACFDDKGLLEKEGKSKGCTTEKK